MSLGLADITLWEDDQKIIEYQVAKKGELASMSIIDFADEVSVDSPVPGGGSVAAMCGSMAAALAAMVGNLTHGKKGYEAAWEKSIEVSDKGQKLKDFFLVGIDRDSQSFDDVLAAGRLPKKTDAEKEARAEAMQAAMKGAVGVPMETLEATIEALEISKVIAGIGNVNSVSDAGVAAQCARAGAIGAAYNVLINLDGINDEAFVNESRAKATELRAKAEKIAAEVDELVMSKF